MARASARQVSSRAEHPRSSLNSCKRCTSTRTRSKSPGSAASCSYTKCRRVTQSIQRIANELVSQWSRPIIKRSALFRDRQVPTINFDVEPSAGRGEKLNTLLARARKEDESEVRKNVVMISSTIRSVYTVAPKENAGLAKVNMSNNTDFERRRRLFTGN